MATGCVAVEAGVLLLGVAADEGLHRQQDEHGQREGQQHPLLAAGLVLGILEVAQLVDSFKGVPGFFPLATGN